MIADVTFGRPDARGVRALRFVPRSSIPLAAACLVANGLRETLRELFGERCELTIGEPTAIDARAWATVSRDAHCFVTYGRQTDIVLVLPRRDARALVMRAFGEGDAPGATALSALEMQAVERIAARCAVAFDPLCAERRGASQTIGAESAPVCVAYFDVRVHAPVALELGIGIVRDLPDPGPAGTLPAALLGAIPVEVRAVVGSGTIDAAALLRLTPGQVLDLGTAFGTGASLKVGERSFASGIAGVSRGRYSFEIHAVRGMMGADS